jgi:hypothetical protein
LKRIFQSENFTPFCFTLTFASFSVSSFCLSIFLMVPPSFPGQPALFDGSSVTHSKTSTWQNTHSNCPLVWPDADQYPTSPSSEAKSPKVIQESLQVNLSKQKLLPGAAPGGPYSASKHSAHMMPSCSQDSGSLKSVCRACPLVLFLKVKADLVLSGQ